MKKKFMNQNKNQTKNTNKSVKQTNLNNLLLKFRIK